MQAAWQVARLVSWFFCWMAGVLSASAQVQRIPLENPDFALIPDPGHIHSDGRERIYVADPDEGVIRVFHKDGRYLRAIGSKGEGPGQFKRWFGTFTLGASGDVLQVDFFGGNRWINVFDANGKFKKTIPIDVEGVYGPFQLFSPHPEQMVMGYMIHWRTEKKGPLYMGKADSHLVGLDGEGNLGAHFTKTTLTHEISEYPDREGRPIPAQNELLSAMSPDGKWLVFMRSDEEKLQVVPMVEGERRTLSHGFKKRKVTKETVAQFVEKRLEETLPAFRGYERRLYGRMVKYASRHKALQPIVDRLFFNPSGVLFLVKQDRQSKEFDVIRLDLVSEKKSRFRSARVPAVFLKDQAVFLEVNEEDGLATLVIDMIPEPFR